MALAGYARDSLAAPEALVDAAPAATTSPDVVESEASPSPREVEGLRELERASHFLDEAEKIEDEAERRRKYEIAVGHAERAVELIPDNAHAHFVLFGSKGRIAQMGGLASAALALASLNAELDECLRLDPDHADALAARGGMLMKLPRLMGGDTAEGVRHLERANQINPNGAGTRLELAEAYEIVGRETAALRAGRESLAIAERKNEPEKAARARQFISDLEASCNSCALAATTD